MRHSSYPVPDWTAPWSAADLKEFLRDARAYYEAKKHPAQIKRNHGLPWDSPYRIAAKAPPSAISILEWLYKLGRDHRVLPLDFGQFCREIKEERCYSRRKWKKIARRRAMEMVWEPCRWIDPLPYRVRNQHAHVPKKVLSVEEIARRDWREHKQFNRDHSQYEGWRRGGGRKTWAKRYSNRMERRHVRHCLHEGKEILPHKLFNDPWMWD